MKKLFFIFALSSFPANAEEGFKCNAEGNNSEMAQCAYDDYKKADAKLNKAYSVLMKKAKAYDKEYGNSFDDHGFVKSLKDAQLTWIKFRDAECYLQTTDVIGGTLRRITYPACLEQLTIERTKQLQQIMEAN